MSNPNISHFQILQVENDIDCKDIANAKIAEIKKLEKEGESANQKQTGRDDENDTNHSTYEEENTNQHIYAAPK